MIIFCSWEIAKNALIQIQFVFQDVFGCAIRSDDADDGEDDADDVRYHSGGFGDYAEYIHHG